MKKIWRIALFPALALTILGAVIWAKLRLVGGIPRTAYAAPDPAPVPGASAPHQGPKTAGPANEPAP